MNEQTKAVVTVIGKDNTGILADVSAAVAAAGASVKEMTQSILDGYFCMIMIVGINADEQGIEDLKARITEAVPDMQVHVMHENIFNSMHRI